MCCWVDASSASHDVHDPFLVFAGGLFGTYEWLATPKADLQDPTVRQILRDIEYGSGLPPMHTIEDVRKAAAVVGFEWVSDHDLALDTAGTRPWYHKLDMGYISTRFTHYFTSFMETVGLAPTGSLATHSMLLHAADGLVRGGKTGVFTPMHLVILQKPAQA
jgi:24-methylenesterol C-methyltransferase